MLSKNELIIRDLMYAYADKGIITIPVNEKKPVIMDWNDLKPLADEYTAYQRIDDMFNDKFLIVTGLAIVLGKENPTLSCCDIDSNDQEIVERLLNTFPSQVNKVGRKGCSFFYRNSDEEALAILKFKIASGGQVEIFNSNKYIVIPPSLHSKDGEEGHHYFWLDESCTLLTIESIDDLPFIEYSDILNIDKLIGSPSRMAANKNLPLTLQYDSNGISDGRNDALGVVIGSIVKRTGGVLSISEVTQALLKFDSENSPKNSFFEYVHNKKHAEIRRDRTREINANAYASAYLHSISKRDNIVYKEASDIVMEKHESGLFFHPIIHIGAVAESDANIFLPEYIPPFFRKFCVDMSESFGVSLHSIFFALLGALGGVLQSKFVIRPIKNNIFFQRTNLSTILLGYSGSKKSDILKHVMWRVTYLNNTLKSANSQDLMDEHRGNDKRMEALMKSRDKANAEGDKEEAKSISKEIYQLQDEMNDLLKKIKPTLFLYHSATVQKMVKDHSLNSKNGLMFIADEFNNYLALMHKKGNEEFRNYMMECQNGDSFFESSTLSRGIDRVDPCYASFLTTYQPDSFESRINDLYNGRKLENDGFWQRFSFISMGRPDLTAKHDFNVADYDKEYKLFDHAFYMEPREVNVLPDAIEKYNNLLKKIEYKADEYYSKPISGFISKNLGRVCKYGILADFMLQQGRCLGISEDGIDYAEHWIDFQIKDIVNMFKMGEVRENIVEQVRLIDMIKSGVLCDGETVGKWHQQCKGTFRSVEHLIKHLTVLEKCNYIKMISIGSRSFVVNVNPEIRTYVNNS